MNAARAAHRVRERREPDVVERAGAVRASRAFVKNLSIRYRGVVASPHAARPEYSRRAEPDLLDHRNVEVVRHGALKGQLWVVAAEEERAAAAQARAFRAKVSEVA